MKLDPCYKYIHVGSIDKPLLQGMLRDDQGENISRKNPYYCELTALYWSWKNSSAKYKGICHYRRYLSKHYFGKNIKKEIYTQKEMLEILSIYDLMLPKPKWRHHKNKLWHWYKHIEELENDVSYAVIKKAISDIYPDYLNELNNVYMGDKMIFCNVIYGRAEIVNKYCEWLFPVAKKIEDIYIKANDEVPTREIGFAGEYLLNVWIMKNSEYLKIYYTPLMRTDRNWGIRLLLSACLERTHLLPILDKISHKYFL